ncbi:hypothetical protein [Nonomuraea sp. NPDC049784]|uniref:hypothetical protein n=1 Tax=Nonomuraea sp. NPDC049784 TaxID=3154361 RepID=UPI0033F4D26D
MGESPRGYALDMRVTLVADPDLPTELAMRVARDLPGRLRQRLGPGLDWEVRTYTAPLAAEEQVDISAMLTAVRPQLPESGWDIGIFLTDLPRRLGLDAVSAEVSSDDRVALLSLPALGGFQLAGRTLEAVVDVIGLLLHPPTSRDRVAGEVPVIGRRVTRDAEPGRIAPDRYVMPGLRGRMRLLAGMVRANRPWRLFTSLSRALAGVFATAAFGVINDTAWQLSNALDAWRQTLIMVLSVLALAAWIIVDHELWERPGGWLPKARARLYNTVTLITITLGVLCLYAVLFVVLTGVGALVLVPGPLAGRLNHRPSVTDYLTLAWFLTSGAMVGGAFGSGLEDDGTVRKAAYGHRQRDRLAKQ